MALVIRSSMKVDLAGSVIIFDEAHNMEDAAREAASQTFDLEDLHEAAKECRLFANNTNEQLQTNYEPLSHVSPLALPSPADARRRS